MERDQKRRVWALLGLVSVLGLWVGLMLGIAVVGGAPGREAAPRLAALQDAGAERLATAGDPFLDRRVLTTEPAGDEGAADVPMDDPAEATEPEATEAVSEEVPTEVLEEVPAEVAPHELAADEAEVAEDEAAEIAAVQATETPVETGSAAPPEPAVTVSDEPAEDPRGPAEVLSEADVTRYRKIFDHQGRAQWKSADNLIAALEDRRLVGYALAQRYLHPTGYRSSYRELRSWLANYADLPDAGEIYKLAMKKRPRGGVLPRQPEAKRDTLAKLGFITSPPYKSKKRLTRSQRRRVRQLQWRIRRQVDRNQLTQAEALIGSAEVQRLFDEVQADGATARVAAGWFYYGKYVKASSMAEGAAERSGLEVPLALWAAGLSAWRNGDVAKAAGRFESYARASHDEPWTASAGAYWAARAHAALGNAQDTEFWLRSAAKHPRTFYGLIAAHRLGHRPECRFATPPLDGRRAGALQAEPEGARALAFLQLGDQRRVEKELMTLPGWHRTHVAEAILAVAERLELPSLSVRVARRLVEADFEGWDEQQLDAALYPVPPWQPDSGFIVDMALVYGFMRQESQFKVYAKSRDGARGLMQLLPSTASFMARGRRFAGRNIYALYAPSLNIDLGQRYIKHLLEHPRIKGDLFRLAVGYNGGPGNLGKWSRRIPGDDPLLFIESLPVRETRMFVERVMTNFWIYRTRLGQPTPALAAVAEDRRPIYEALDSKFFSEPSPVPVAQAETLPWWKFW